MDWKSAAFGGGPAGGGGGRGGGAMPVVYAGTNQMHAGMTPIMATTAPQVFTRGGKKKKKGKLRNGGGSSRKVVRVVQSSMAPPAPPSAAAVTASAHHHHTAPMPPPAPDPAYTAAAAATENYWTKVFDQYEQEYFYKHTTTQETTWTRPAEYSTDTDPGDYDEYYYQQEGAEGVYYNGEYAASSQEAADAAAAAAEADAAAAVTSSMSKKGAGDKQLPPFGKKGVAISRGATPGRPAGAGAGAPVTPGTPGGDSTDDELFATPAALNGTPDSSIATPGANPPMVNNHNRNGAGGGGDGDGSGVKRALRSRFRGSRSRRSPGAMSAATASDSPAATASDYSGSPQVIASSSAASKSDESRGAAAPPPPSPPSKTTATPAGKKKLADAALLTSPAAVSDPTPQQHRGAFLSSSIRASRDRDKYTLESPDASQGKQQDKKDSSSSGRGRKSSLRQVADVALHVASGKVVAIDVHKAEVARLESALESAKQQAALQLRLTTSELKAAAQAELDALKLQHNQELRELDTRLRETVKSSESDALSAQKEVLARERREMVQRYAAETRAMKQEHLAALERAKVEAYEKGVASVQRSLEAAQARLTAAEERLRKLQEDMDAKREKIAALEAAAVRADSAVAEATSRAQVAVLEERERLVTASAKERAEAVAELRTALDQRAEEIAQLRATAAKEREELVASAKAEYYRGRSDTSKEWTTKVKQQEAARSSVHEKQMELLKATHEARLEQVKSEVESTLRAKLEEKNASAVASVRKQMESLLREEQHKLEAQRDHSEAKLAELRQQLQKAAEKAAAEFHRGREGAIREWSEKVQEGSVVAAADADRAASERIALLEARHAAETEAKVAKLTAEAAARVSAAREEAAGAAAKHRAEIEEARSAIAAAERARDAAEERVAAATSQLEALTAEHQRVVRALSELKSSANDATSSQMAALEKAVASKRKYKSQVEQLKALLTETGEEASRERDEAVAAAVAAERARLESQFSKKQAQSGEDLLAKHARELTNAAREREAAVREAAAARAKLQQQFEAERSELLSSQAARVEAEVSARVSAAIEEQRSVYEPRLQAAEAAREKAITSWHRETELRRKAHNRVLELQGNIRVMCRVRPVLPVERQSGEAEVATQFPQEDTVVLAPKRGGGSKQVFEFDRVFQPEVSQSSVFEEVRPLVTSVMDGYNVCIFAYGQTGSGKTHTMEGEPDDPGVNLRALKELFGVADARKATASYTIEVSILEIYNEMVRDLLGNDGKTLNIKSASRSGERVEGLTRVTVATPEEVVVAMRKAASSRAVGGHDVNARSSRSHCVVTVHVARRQANSSTASVSKLNLIDLAGSERLSKTHASGERLKEAQFINKSLSALGNVIEALGAKSKKVHVPFRNSKLTHLLQDSLSQGSKVMMFVNASPVMWNLSETSCSLKFAQRCAAVTLGQAKKSGDSVAHLKAVIADLQEALAAATGRSSGGRGGAGGGAGAGSRSSSRRSR